ncbi:MAG: hypothetical protein ACRDOA_01505 [Streptosporangiaceae bacterium]
MLQERADDTYGVGQAGPGQEPADGLAGRFQANSAPTVAEAPMNTIATTPSAGLPVSAASFGGNG